MKLMNECEMKKGLSEAIAHFWKTRLCQTTRQRKGGRSDQGARGAVTGGAQMDGFVKLFEKIISDAGFPDTAIYRKQSLELPGFFRPTKEWDLLVVSDNKLVAVIEAKSQVGPSFGNNFNNRTEEAMGSSLDLWTAYREGAFSSSPQPWLGYLFLLEDCSGSQSPVKVREPHFKVFPEFQNASYSKRYEIFCRKLVRERHYNSAVFITSKSEEGQKGLFLEPADDVGFAQFVSSLSAHIGVFVK